MQQENRARRRVQALGRRSREVDRSIGPTSTGSEVSVADLIRAPEAHGSTAVHAR
jgi:hypothetical protein